MKYRLWLCLLVAIGWVYTVPQIYVGQYSSILGSAVHWGAATVIYATCVMSLWLLLISDRPRAKLLMVAGLVLWGLTVVGVWKWIYFYPGQIYKTVWFYVGAFSPFWALASIGLIFLVWRSSRKAPLN